MVSFSSLLHEKKVGWDKTNIMRKKNFLVNFNIFFAKIKKYKNILYKAT